MYKYLPGHKDPAHYLRVIFSPAKFTSELRKHGGGGVHKGGREFTSGERERLNDRRRAARLCNSG